MSLVCVCELRTGIFPVRHVGSSHEVFIEIIISSHLKTISSQKKDRQQPSFKEMNSFGQMTPLLMRHITRH